MLRRRHGTEKEHIIIIIIIRGLCLCLKLCVSVTVQESTSLKWVRRTKTVESPCLGMLLLLLQTELVYANDIWDLRIFIPAPAPQDQVVVGQFAVILLEQWLFNIS